MLRQEMERYRSLLESQLDVLVGHGSAAVHDLADVRVEELPDPADRATREEDRNWSLRLRDRDRKLAMKIEEALARIDAGTFGICERCSQPISEARLRARPVTTLCIACKTETERRERA